MNILHLTSSMTTKATSDEGAGEASARMLLLFVSSSPDPASSSDDTALDTPGDDTALAASSAPGFSFLLNEKPDVDVDDVEADLAGVSAAARTGAGVCIPVTRVGDSGVALPVVVAVAAIIAAGDR